MEPRRKMANHLETSGTSSSSGTSNTSSSSTMSSSSVQSKKSKRNMATIAGKRQRIKRKKLSLALGEKRRSESKENSSQRQSHRVHPHAQPRPGTRASASVGQKFLERRDDLLITALVEFDEKNSRIPVLFSTADKWEDFYKKIFSALNNKCNSFLMTYSCRNTQVLLNKDIWAVFIHFLKTQCEDQTVFINLACSSASVNNKLRYGLVQSSDRPTTLPSRNY